MKIQAKSNLKSYFKTIVLVSGLSLVAPFLVGCFSNENINNETTSVDIDALSLDEALEIAETAKIIKFSGIDNRKMFVENSNGERFWIELPHYQKDIEIMFTVTNEEYEYIVRNANFIMTMPNGQSLTMKKYTIHLDESNFLPRG